MTTTSSGKKAEPEPDYRFATPEQAAKVRETLEIRGSDHAIFLGAGASVPLGMPSATQFLDEALVGDLGDVYRGTRKLAGPLDLVAYLFRDVNSEGVPVSLDIEVIWERLDKLRRVYEAHDDASLGTAYAIARAYVTKGEMTFENYRDLVDRHDEGIDGLRQLVRTTEELLVQKLQAVYGVPGDSTVDELWDPYRMVLSSDPPPPIFTTNYDLAAEKIISRIGLGGSDALVDGFVVRHGQSPTWDSEALHTWPVDTIPLLKLHGSVNWYRYHGEVRRHGHDEPQVAMPQSEVALVPPVLAKLDLSNEWSPTLYGMLEVALACVPNWLVVGFSFRDETIRSMFERALEARTVKRCLIVAPVGDDETSRDLKKFVAGASEGSKRGGTIVHVNAGFGTEQAQDVVMGEASTWITRHRTQRDQQSVKGGIQT